MFRGIRTVADCCTLAPVRRRPLASGAAIVVGIAVIALSLPRGQRSKEHYGSWDKLII
jgi:hypothetical protein